MFINVRKSHPKIASSQKSKFARQADRSSPVLRELNQQSAIPTKQVRLPDVRSDQLDWWLTFSSQRQLTGWLIQLMISPDTLEVEPARTSVSPPTHSTQTRSVLLLVVMIRSRVTESSSGLCAVGASFRTANQIFSAQIDNQHKNWTSSSRWN